MKIVKIETKRLNVPLKRPFQTALRRVESLEDLVVVITTQSGLQGYGEGAPTPVITGETMGTMQAVIEYLTPFLLGRDMEEFDALIETIHSRILKNSTAKSALEIALYDLKAKTLQLPLFRMLGGTETHFKTDITISLGETEQMVADALEAVGLGYDTLKIKVGSQPEKDIERMEAIHEAVGKNITLRLDANQGWMPEECISIMHSLESKGIFPELIEQPIKAEDIEGLRAIKASIKTPLLADESVFTLGDAKRLLDLEAADLINIKLAKCGGISNALKLADLAGEYGVKCMIGCMLEGPISVGAAVHVASAKADIITMIDLDAVALCQANPVNGGVLFNESNIILSESFGLGVKF